MLLKELLQIHDTYKHLSGLPTHLCDGFLYHRNPIYRNIRDLTNVFGFSFLQESLYDYDVFPLASLPRILKDKKIPYKDHVSGLTALERLAPGKIRLTDLSHFDRSYLFHESAHCLVEKAFESLPRGARQDQVLYLLLSESMAFTCELLGSLHVDSPAHLNAYSVNSLPPMLENRRLLETSIARHGFEKTCKLTLISYLLAHFLFEEVSDDDAIRATRLCGVDSQVTAEIRSILQIGFQITDRFRLHTTNFYFKYIGIEEGVKALTNVDCLQLLENDPSVMDRLKLLSSWIENGKATLQDASAA